MKLFFNDFDSFFGKEFKRKIKKALKAISTIESIKDKYIVELTIVESTKMTELNFLYRKINKDTDVLSFGSISNVLPNSLLLGEIFINYDKVVSQAKEYNHSVERELLFLFTHGIYHLLDFDHLNEKDENIMISKQLLILDKIKSYRI
ncbi:MAG: rRNA maturation RNase YbeY [Malacoplasma sp.]